MDGDVEKRSIELTLHQWYSIRNHLVEDLEINAIKHIYSPQAVEFQQRIIKKIEDKILE